MQRHNSKIRKVSNRDAGSGPAGEPAFAAAEDAKPRVASAPVEMGGGAARDLQQLLQERLFAPLAPAALPDDEARKPRTDDQREIPEGPKLPVRAIKILLGLAIVALFGWIPLRTLLQPSSVEAIVNTRLVTIRAPIEGEIVATPDMVDASGVLPGGKIMLRIKNVRADRSRLDRLNDELAEVEVQRSTIESKIGLMQGSYEELDADVEAFTAGRIRQLESRVTALSAEVGAANARRGLAESEAERATLLARSDTISTAALERLTQEWEVARQAAIAAEGELDAANIELEAARSGSFIGDSYNDIPSSAQRRIDLRQRLDELNADLVAADARIKRLEAEVAKEEVHYQSFADVAVTLPVPGRIWEVMTAPGEHVEAGQDLLKLLDCSGAVVTAKVTESVYNQLRVGAPARFLPTDGGAAVSGVIVNLTGFANAPANLAIVPSSLDGEAYHVTVQVPDLVSGETCAIGRTGRVIFD